MKHSVHLILQVIFWSVIYYFRMPRFSLGFAGIFWYAFLSSLIASAFYWPRKKVYSQDPPTGSWAAPAVTGGILLIMLLGWASTWPIFRASSYRNLIKVERKDFAGSFDLVDPHRARVVTWHMAHRLASIKLGEHAGLSSRVMIGELAEQKVGDLIYWVAPLEHIGFWQWRNNGITPGYVMVCSSNEQDVRLVEKLGDEDIRMRYLECSFLGDSVQRLVYRAFPSLGATDFTFEIDDEGKPFVVATLYANKVGWSGPDTVGVAVVDVQTGDIKRYGLDEVPEWIDRVEPESMVHDQLVGWGDYVHGWLNSLGGNDVIHPSDEAALVYGADGRTYWYFDARGSKTKNGSGAMGHFLVDSRTKATTLYEVAGAAHEVAQWSIQGEVQQMRYACGRVLPYMAHGEMVYMGPLLDQANLRKGIGLALYRDPSIVGTGDTVDEALRALKKHMTQKGHDLAPNRSVQVFEVRGVVKSCNLQNGTLYVRLDQVTERGFAVPFDLNEEARFVALGDEVILRYEMGDEPVVDVVGFDDLRLNFAPKPTRATAAAK